MIVRVSVVLPIENFLTVTSVSTTYNYEMIPRFKPFTNE